MKEETERKLIGKCDNIRRKHLAPTEEIQMREGMIYSESDSKRANAYTAALLEAERLASAFPSGKDEYGREWIEIDGKRYPRDWFIRSCARMKADKTI